MRCRSMWGSLAAHGGGVACGAAAPVRQGGRDERASLNKETGQYLDFTVKKGDRVIFSSYAGTEIKIDGQEYLIMTEDDILGTIDG